MTLECKVKKKMAKSQKVFIFAKRLVLMKITLPPRTQGEAFTISVPRMTVIGANGAGKTRFGRALGSLAAERAYNMSALKALYAREDEDAAPNSIDGLYRQAVATSVLIRPDVRGELDRLIALMVNEAVVDLLAEKYTPEAAPGHKHESRLDTVIRLWQELFPDNKILITYGKMLINNVDSSDVYSASTLSAGERAVMYYLGAALFAPRDGVVIVSSPEMFLHASVVRPLWDMIEHLRPDCTFVYVTHDLSFAATRADSAIIWVKSCDSDAGTWDYERLPSVQGMPDEIYLTILGERKPVLFIEGDGVHSYDARLYPLVFREYTVKSLGGCEQVIEATRAFNGSQSIHNLDAIGIVDRDRRAEAEVTYLRSRKVLVPDVAEIENLFMLEDVVKTIAASNGRQPEQAFAKLRRNLMHLFEGNLKRQALEHTRHSLKKEVTHRVDGKFESISRLESHISELMLTINPRGIYNDLLREFNTYLAKSDYRSILRVFNHKSMLTETHVASICGIRGDDYNTYIKQVLKLMKGDSPEGEAIRSAIRRSFNV